MEPAFYVPIIAIILGTSLAAAIVAVVLNHQWNEKRMFVESEVQKMEIAYQRARASLARG